MGEWITWTTEKASLWLAFSVDLVYAGPKPVQVQPQPVLLPQLGQV